MTGRVRALLAGHRGRRVAGSPPPPPASPAERPPWPVQPSQLQVWRARAVVDRFHAAAQDLQDDGGGDPAGWLHLAVELWDAACVLDAALHCAERGEPPWPARG